MTGYGRAETLAEGGWRLVAELSGVNRKQADVSVHLPSALAAAETEVRQRIAAGISRGRIDVRVNVEQAGSSGAEAAGSGAGSRLKFDRRLAEEYLAAIDSMVGESQRPVEFRPVDLLRAPGVFSIEERGVDAEDVLPDLLRTVDEAFEALVKMQRAEGAHLRDDLSARLDAIAAHREAIAARAPEVLSAYRDNLHKRLEQAGLESEGLLDDERVVRELALYADRCDISEELTRIDSHLRQFRDYLAADAGDGGAEPVGRPLDFLCQELNREFNTIGSKANDAGISQHVVALKTELEKVREQVQNVQ